MVIYSLGSSIGRTVTRPLAPSVKITTSPTCTPRWSTTSFGNTIRLCARSRTGRSAISAGHGTFGS